MPRKQAKPTAGAEPADGPIQFLSPDGLLEPDSRLELPPAVDLLALYRDMALVRRLDTEAIALQRQGELGLWPSLRGQEAAQVGAAYALAEQDMVFPTYREHGVAWCRGLDPVSLLGLFRGSTLGGWNPYERRFGLYTLVIGAQTLHAVGYGMGLVRDDVVGSGDDTRDTAVLVFLGDGALSEGETNEAFLWAAAQNLPVVFFCQNNQWAISAPYSVQSRVPVAQRAAGFGFPGVSVDGNDVLACLAATREALTRARSGGGPTLIEAVTYRINAHTTADDATRYRPSAETDEWAAKDPLERLRLHLTASGGVGDTGGVGEEYFADIERREQELAEHLRAGCRALPVPDHASSFENTYADMPAELKRQLAEHSEFLASGFLAAGQEIGATR
ncbi:thiamine pyrophosphate-dependent dehydrogenase E1 component subunit alpha [Streptomyces phaeochromogenes]|uniref:thiamine pyrophosphate-dependent dehydrogenase E1 component subunit alpha n=1 Tax=Streptomyces phaeochromogenes TaxID=1923 RepID=UPI0006E3C699|nr:thiamine pyrophosphate-dependent dehydrogenase E1 component subunit alpha [Streptomyces phaeochromogenes]